MIAIFRSHHSSYNHSLQYISATKSLIIFNELFTQKVPEACEINGKIVTMCFSLSGYKERRTLSSINHLRQNTVSICQRGFVVVFFCFSYSKLLLSLTFKKIRVTTFLVSVSNCHLRNVPFV